MSDLNELSVRMDNVIASVQIKAKQEQQVRLQDHVARMQLLKEYEKAQAKVLEVAKPRLEALAKKAGDRVKVTPTGSHTRRAAAFEFRSPRAVISLGFSVAPDADVKNIVVDNDLRIVPVLWKFDSHSDFSTPISSPDLAGLTKWLDDRIIGFLELYVRIHEGDILDKAEYVEDPVAKVSFPKFAAGATIEQGGKTHYFIDESTRKQFAGQTGTSK